MFHRLALALVVGLAGCTERGSGGVDAAPDGNPPPPDTVDPCAASGKVSLTGELIDLDSSPAAFEGVFGAKLALVGDPSVFIATPPNGRLDTCVSLNDPLTFDLDAPTEFLDGAVVVSQAARRGFRPLSLRAIKSARAVSFYTERGLTFDATRAHVLVFQAGDRADVRLDRPHETAQAGEEDAQGAVAWSAGSAGRYVLFPNVDVAMPTGTIDGGQPGPMSIPLTAGELTIAAISLVFR